MVIPGQLIFVLAITFLRDGQGHTISFTFVMLYLMAALIQVMYTLLIGYVRLLVPLINLSLPSSLGIPITLHS